MSLRLIIAGLHAGVTALAALQAPPHPCSDCPWHPVNAHRADVTHALQCEADTATLSYRNSYKFAAGSSGRSAELLSIRASFRTLNEEEEGRLGEFLNRYAIVERVKGRCFQGDFLIDIYGISKAELDYAATHGQSRSPGEVMLTVTIGRKGGLKVVQIGWRKPLEAEPSP